MKNVKINLDVHIIIEMHDFEAWAFQSSWRGLDHHVHKHVHWPLKAHQEIWSCWQKLFLKTCLVTYMIYQIVYIKLELLFTVYICLLFFSAGVHFNCWNTR